MYNFPIDKKLIVAASYILGDNRSLILVFSIVMSSVVSFIKKNFHKCFFIFYAKVSRRLFFLSFFLDLFFSEISAIITAAVTCSWIILLKFLKVGYPIQNAFMNLVWTTCMEVQKQWKSENRLWVTQVVSYKSFNVSQALLKVK